MMVNKSSLFLLLALLPNLGHAQLFKNIGFRTGVNYTRFEWKVRIDSSFPAESLSSEKTIGFNAFVTSDLLSYKSWDVNSSLGFVQKNGTTSYLFFSSAGQGGSTAEIRYKLNYISWINVARGKLPVSNSFLLTAQLGPRFEYLINPSDHLEEYTPSGSGFFYRYEEGDVQKLNIGLSGSLGLLLNLKSMKIGVDVWRNINFNPITSAKGPRRDGLGDEGFYLKMRDRTYMLNVLCIFDL